MLCIVCLLNVHNAPCLVWNGWDPGRRRTCNSFLQTSHSWSEETQKLQWREKTGKRPHTLFKDKLRHTLFAILTGFYCVPTLSRPGEQNLWLQPDRPVSVHHRSGCGVRQTHQILPLLLLNPTQKQTDEGTYLEIFTSAAIWEVCKIRLALWMSKGITYLRTSGCGAIMAAFFTSSQLALRLANHK